jgi:hypothetical protein
MVVSSEVPDNSSIFFSDLGGGQGIQSYFGYYNTWQ